MQAVNESVKMTLFPPGDRVGPPCDTVQYCVYWDDDVDGEIYLAISYFRLGVPQRSYWVLFDHPGVLGKEYFENQSLQNMEVQGHA